MSASSGDDLNCEQILFSSSAPNVKLARDLDGIDCFVLGGVLADSSLHSVDLLLENQSPEEIQLSAIRYSCSCTSVEIEEHLIPSGGAVPLRVTLVPGGEGSQKSQIDFLFNRPRIGIKPIRVQWDAQASLAFADESMSLHSLPKPGEVVDIGVVVRDAKDVLNGLYAVVLPSDLAEAGINLNDSCVHLRFKREPLYLDYAYVTLFRKDGTTLDTMVLSFAEPQAGSLRMLEQVVFFRDMKKAEWAFAPLTIVGLADKLESGAIGEVEVSFDGDGTARIDSRDGDNLRVAVRSNGTLPDGSLQLEFDGKRTLSVPVLMQFAPEEE